VVEVGDGLAVVVAVDLEAVRDVVLGEYRRHARGGVDEVLDAGRARRDDRIAEVLVVVLEV
jgi:hypothetical protein